MIFRARTTIFFLPALLLCCSAKAQLIPETSLVFSQSSERSKTDLGGGVEFGDRIGQALASGDFNGDGHLDLVIAVPYEDQGDNTESGWVHVVYGRRGGLSAEDDEIWSQAGAIEGLVEPRDESGFSVTTGDFNGDGIDDLAFGSPGEDIGSIFRAGAINVIYGSPSGLTDVNNRGFNQDTTGISGVSEEGDQMGYSLAAGDFNNDGFDDVAIGVPTEDIGTVEDAGTVQVLLGSASGLATEGNFFLDRSADGMGGVAIDDVFGNALAVGDFNGVSSPTWPSARRSTHARLITPGRFTSFTAGVGALTCRPMKSGVWTLPESTCCPPRATSSAAVSPLVTSTPMASMTWWSACAVTRTAQVPRWSSMAPMKGWRARAIASCSQGSTALPVRPCRNPGLPTT